MNLCTVIGVPVASAGALQSIHMASSQSFSNEFGHLSNEPTASLLTWMFRSGRRHLAICTHFINATVFQENIDLVQVLLLSALRCGDDFYK